MSDPYVKPKLTGFSKKPGLSRKLKTLYVVVLIFGLYGLFWLMNKRFARDPLAQVDSCLSDKKFDKASRLNFDLLKKFPEHRLALLMNGSIINFGLRELNITDIKLPFYEYDDFLNAEDKTGIFIRQSFIKKFTIFPDSKYFVEEFCAFQKKFPESLRNPEASLVIARAFHSRTVWNPVSDECVSLVFGKNEAFSELFGIVKGDNLSLRKNPGIKEKLIKKLKKNDLVLIKYTGEENIIGEKKGKWLSVFTEDQKYGWVFGAYIEISGTVGK
ncbi:MAG: SH3 domain-containing protein [Spirochaetia bacterium]|nr:SH3 domain-containing protein [Spirochaetia bacterium]